MAFPRGVYGADYSFLEEIAAITTETRRAWKSALTKSSQYGSLYAHLKAAFQVFSLVKGI